MIKQISVFFLFALLSIVLIGCAPSQNIPSPIEQTIIPSPIPQTPTTHSPSEVIPYSVEVTKGLVFSEQTLLETSKERKLDLYTPDKAGNLPLLLFLPELGESRGLYKKLGQAIAEQGVMVLVVEYPFNYPDYLIRDKGQGYRNISDTVVCAIRSGRAAALDLGNETTFVAISGFSVGGGAAAHIALAGESANQIWEEYAASSEGPPSQVECTVSEGSTQVDALVGIAGAYDAFVGYEGNYGREFMQERDPALWELLFGTVGKNPELKVRLLHSESDSTIPYDNSVEFSNLLTEAGYDVELIQYEGAHNVPVNLIVKTIIDVFGDLSID